MSYEHKPNTGTIFQRDAGGNEKAPTDTGDAMLTCPHCSQPFWAKIAGWFKQSQDASKSNRINLAFAGFKTRQELESAKKPKQPQQTPPRSTTRPDGGINPPNDPQGDDVPF